MVHLNQDPFEAVGGDMAKRVDNPGSRPTSNFFDGEYWNQETRDRLGIRQFARIEIPNTNKADMKKYAELLHGLATQMEYLAANTALTEHMASLQFRNAASLINQELKIIGKIDLREQKNRGSQKKQRNRTNTISSNSGEN